MSVVEHHFNLMLAFTRDLLHARCYIRYWRHNEEWNMVPPLVISHGLSQKNDVGMSEKMLSLEGECLVRV